MFYLGEVRDSDGNDCTVYDVIVEAPNRDSAVDRIFDWVHEEWPKDEDDGNYGTYHPCYHECEHGKRLGKCRRPKCDSLDCEGDGGVLGPEPDMLEEYDTAEQAIAASSFYHTPVYFTE